MGTLSSSSLSSSRHQDASTCDEFSLQQGLLLSDSLKDLKNLRSQLYSAAEYFELSYNHNSQKPTIMSSLKDYTVEALVSTVDHLGFVTYKVNDLLTEKVDEVSETEIRVSSAEQRIRTCRDFIDQQGWSEQSLVIKAPKYHKHYILQGKNTLASGILPISKYQQQSNVSDPVGKSHDLWTAASPPINRPPTIRKTRSPSPSRSSMRRSRSLSPSRKARSSSPSQQIEDHSLKINGSGKREATPLPLPTPLPRTTSLASTPAFPNSSNIVRRYSLETQNSVHLRPERREEKETGRSSSKSKGFLKSLLTRRRRWKTDESLYSYLDEY